MTIKKINIRRITQIFFFALVALLAFNHTLSETGQGLPWIAEVSLHAICPFGGIVTLYSLATVGDYIKKIHESSLVILGISTALALLFGPVLCGWICPLGSIQEWIGLLGKKIFKHKYNTFVPKDIDKPLRYLRYFTLAWVIYVTAKSATLVFLNVDPYFALMNFYSGEVTVSALIVLGLTLGGSLFVERPWCKYACPYGAYLGLFNKIRIFKLKRHESTCIHCTKCDRVCPMNIDISHSDVISDLQCISCMECTSDKACPIPNTLNFEISKGN